MKVIDTINYQWSCYLFQHNTLNNSDMPRTLQKYLNNRFGTSPVFSPEHMGVFFVCSGCAKKNINIVLWTAMITGTYNKTHVLVNVSGIRITLWTLDAFIMCSVCVPCSQDNTDILLCAPRTHKEHVHLLRRERLEVFPICYILVFEKVFWACQNYFEWGCYRSNRFDFPVFLLIEGVSYSVYPEITMDIKEGQMNKAWYLSW